MDSLHAFLSSVKSDMSNEDAVRKALQDAKVNIRNAAENTKGMHASLGRASYVPEAMLEGNADPGAVAAEIWLGGVIDSILNQQ